MPGDDVSHLAPLTFDAADRGLNHSCRAQRETETRRCEGAGHRGERLAIDEGSFDCAP